MDDQEFHAISEAALDDLWRKLAAASEKLDFEPDFNQGTVTVEFDDPPAKFVVSPNSPVRQIWVSAQSKSFKLDWDAARKSFVLPGSGATLNEMMAGAIGQQLGEEVVL